MVLFPNCKINLGLRVTGKRDDGYHNLETVFYPVPLKDALELTVAPEATDEFELQLSGMPVPGEVDSNICKKAWELIKKDFPGLPPVRLHLLKGIPSGAGLGGGSSDGAHALLLFNQVFELALTHQQLIAYALKLGSDCPFFILNKPCLATGRGEQLQEIPVALDDYYIALIDPEVHISTAWAFSKIPACSEQGMPLADIVDLPVEQWKDTLINDFETPVFEEYESLKLIRHELYQAGAAYASLTGTGSCVYGIFSKKIIPDLEKLREHYKVHVLNHHS